MIICLSIYFCLCIYEGLLSVSRGLNTFTSLNFINVLGVFVVISQTGINEFSLLYKRLNCSFII